MKFKVRDYRKKRYCARIMLKTYGMNTVKETLL
jgi:hypothetical protein